MATRAIVLPAACLLAVHLGCAGDPQQSGDAARRAGADLQAEAERLAKEILIVDTHIDVPDRLQKKMEDISGRTAEGDFDYPRAKAGGLDAAFMSIYVPSKLEKEGGAKLYADGLIDMVEKFERDWPDKFAIARSPDQVLGHAARGLIAFPLGMENGAGIEDDLANLRHFHQRGIRYITLTHSEDNLICDSSYTRGEHRWRGLSPFGRQVVMEMNRLGIMVDVSHLSDEAFRQVMEVSRAPAIASHSSCRAFTPGWERNMDDDMIKSLASRGGVIQINFGSAFLNQKANEQSVAYFDAIRKFRAESGASSGDEKDRQFTESYFKNSPRIYATMADVVAHIDHVIDLAGEDHVGLGSDFDGVGDSLPEGLKDVSGYPNLIRALLDRGFSEQRIRKICGENLMRVWRDVERTARELAG